MQTNLHLILHESLERANERLDLKHHEEEKSPRDSNAASGRLLADCRTI